MVKFRVIVTSIIVLSVVALLSTCNIFGTEPYSERNVNGFKEVKLVNPQRAVKAAEEATGMLWSDPAQREIMFSNPDDNHALDIVSNSLNRLAFGVSSRTIIPEPLPVPVYRADPDTAPGPGVLPTMGKGIRVDNGFKPWGNIIRDSEDLVDPLIPDARKGNTDRQILLTAINQTNNAGKIAGSEDGISYYFKRVPRDVNFKISADFYVDSFGFTAARAELNGQEAFGFMARDWVPQHHNLGIGTAFYPGYDKPRTPPRPGFDGKEYDYAAKDPRFVNRKNPDGIPKSGGAKFDLTEVGLKNVEWNGVYWNGEGTSLNDGVASSSNMIMVGGVKRGMRVYWRTGVQDPDGEKMPVYDFNSIANADYARFDYKPRELSDYAAYGSGIEGTMQRPDFPTAGLTYKLYLEKTNSGFVARIEPPKGVGKGTTKTRIPSDGFVLEYSDRELPFPDLLCGPTSVEKDHYYIGVFAARDAMVTVSNLRYEESPASMCPERIDPVPEAVTPTFLIQSPVSTSAENYTLYARSNVEGNLVLKYKENGKEITKVYENEWIVEPSNASARPFSLFTIPDIKLSLGDNYFDMVFVPDGKQYKSGFMGLGLDKNGKEIRFQDMVPPKDIEYLMTDARAINRSFIVNRRSLSGSDFFGLNNGNSSDNMGDDYTASYGPRFKREVIWVSPTGKATGSGSKSDPLDLKTAIAVSSVTPDSGQMIILMNGIYTPMDPAEVIDGVMRIPIRLIVPRYNSGKPNLTLNNPADPNSGLKYPSPQLRPAHDNNETRYPDPYADEYYRFYKVMKAEERDKVVIDFRKDLRNSGYAPRNFEMNGDYWIIDGIHVRNAEDTFGGLRTHGSNNLFRWVKTYFNGDSGLWVSGKSDEPKRMWPTNVRVEYCESFGNIDLARTNADGFAAKLTTGENIVFYRCISHHNTDDGWDLFAKKETGPIGAVRIEQSFAYSNGRYLNDEVGRNYSESNLLAKKNYSAGVGGNGFKMGGEGIPVTHLVINSLTWGNDGDGVTSNSDPAIQISYVSAFDNYNRVDNNPGSNFAIYSSSSPSYEGLDGIITQVLSWRSDPLGARNDRLEPKAPSSGFVWRNYSYNASQPSGGGVIHPHGIYDGNNGKDSAVLLVAADKPIPAIPPNIPNSLPNGLPGGLKSRSLTGKSVSTLYVGEFKYGQNLLRFGSEYINDYRSVDGVVEAFNHSSTAINLNSTGVNRYYDTGRVLSEDDFLVDPKTQFAYGELNSNKDYINYKRSIFNGGNDNGQSGNTHVSPFTTPGQPYRRLDGSTAGSTSKSSSNPGLANHPQGRIHGDFLVVYDETTAPTPAFIGLPNLHDFMRLREGNFFGELPGAKGLWY